MAPQQLRLRKLRTLIKQWEGTTPLAKKLGLSGPSYLSQILSGNRPFSEKTARKFESQLDLPPGWFDQANDEVMEPVRAAKSGAGLINEVVLKVSEALENAGVKLPRDKFADLVSLVYDHAVAAGGVNPAFIASLVKLLKNH